MKIYLTESTRNHNAFTDYIGTDKDAAVEAGRTAWASLTAHDKARTVIEVQEWELPDDTNVTDEGAVYDAIIEAFGYNLIMAFSNEVLL